MTSPDPVPLPPLPLAAIVTTEGMTWSATGVTAHALTAWEEPDAEPGADELVAELVHPPTTPPTTSAPPSATQGSHRRAVGVRSDSLTLASLLPSAIYPTSLRAKPHPLDRFKC